MLKNLEQIKEEFRVFATAHGEIADYHFGHFLDAYESNALKHSSLIVDCLTAVMGGQASKLWVDLNLRITVCDMVYEDKSNWSEVKSDTLLIIEDVRTVFESQRWRNFSKVVNLPVANYFEQRGGDSVNGWYMDVSLRIHSLRDLCALPLNDYDYYAAYSGGAGGGGGGGLTCSDLPECPTIIAINDSIDALEHADTLINAAITAHTSNTNNPHQVTAAQVGAPTIAEAQGYADDAETNAKAYADLLVAGVLNLRSAYDASGNVFPSSGGSGAGGAVRKGDLWFISVAGTLGTQQVTTGDFIFANVDAPGQSESNWSIGQVNIVYVPENVSNKSTDGTMSSNSDTLYPSQKAAKTYADTKLAKSGGTMTGAVVDAEAAISALNIDWESKNQFHKTITVGSTFTFSNDADGECIRVVLLSDSTGGYTIQWPAGIKWGSQAATQSMVADKAIVYTFLKSNGVIYASYIESF